MYVVQLEALGDIEGMTNLDRMEEVADWLHSDNPCLCQIAEQTIDDLLGPSLLAQMELLREQVPHTIWFAKAMHDLMAMLVLTGDAYSPDVRAWMASVLRQKHKGRPSEQLSKAIWDRDISAAYSGEVQ